MDRLRSSLGTLGVAVSVALVGLVVGLIFTLSAAQLLRLVNIRVGLTAGVVLTLVLTQGFAFGLVALAYLRYRREPVSSLGIRVPSLRELLWVVGGYLLAFLAVGAGAALVTLAGGEGAPNRIGEIGIQNPDLLLLLVPFSFILVGPGEELLFRGVVQGSLRDRFGSAGAVVLASAIFAAVHFVALSGGLGPRLTTIGILFLPSLVFGAAYERTRNLVVPALIHGAYNATLFSLLYVALRYADNPPI